MADEKQSTKVSLEKQFGDSNIKNFEKEELQKMVNATKGDDDFKAAYPDAEFSRMLTYKYLTTKYDYDYIGRGYSIPHGVTIDDLFDAYQKLNGINDDTDMMQKSSDSCDTIEVIVGAKKKRNTFSMNEESMERWEEFVSGLPNKSDYLSAACDLFIKRMEDGKVEMKPVFAKPNITK